MSECGPVHNLALLSSLAKLSGRPDPGYSHRADRPTPLKMPLCIEASFFSKALSAQLMGPAPYLPDAISGLPPWLNLPGRNYSDCASQSAMQRSPLLLPSSNNVRACTCPPPFSLYIHRLPPDTPRSPAGTTNKTSEGEKCFIATRSGNC